MHLDNLDSPSAESPPLPTVPTPRQEGADAPRSGSRTTLRRRARDRTRRSPQLITSVGGQSMRMRVRTVVWVVGSLLGVTTLVGSANAQGKPIRIGEINSYSGLATVYTFPYKEGLLMAAKEINDAGGVLGRPIEFIFRDDKL